MKKNKGLNKKIIFTVLVCFFIIISLIIAVLYKLYNDSLFKPYNPAGEIKKVEISIDKSNVKSLPDVLYDAGLIKNKTALRIYLRLSGLSSSIKAGKYELTTNLSPAQMINKMVRGEVKKDTIWVTIPEGYTIKDIASLLESKGLAKSDKFVEAVNNFSSDYDFLKDLPKRPVMLEGYLFPDTYEFSKNATCEQIISRMLMRFDEIFDDNMRKKAKDMNMTIDQIVTVASMIEKEAKVEEERPIIAAVIYNRLKIKMMLQIDATVQYALGKWKDRLTIDDTKIDSPYNTYIHTGLPIGPISNPGKKSLEAALNPKNVDYIFYVAKKDGSGAHVFTTTYQEFLIEKKKNKLN